MAATNVATASTAASAINGGNVTLNVSGLLQNDIVVVVGGIGGTTAGAQGATGNNSGAYQTLVLNDSGANQFYIGWQRMGATPDTVITCAGNGDAGDSAAYACQSWRGIKLTSPPTDTATTTATGSGTNPNPPSITFPSGIGTVVIVCALSVVNQAGITPPATFGGIEQATANDGEDASVALASRTNTASPIDPATFGSWGAGVWQAATITLTATSQDLVAGLVSDPETFSAPQINRTSFVALYSDPDTIYAPVIPALVLPGLFTDPDTFYGGEVELVSLEEGTYFGSRYFGASYFGPRYWSTNIAGVQDVTAPIYSDADNIFSPNVIQIQFLTAGLFTNTNTFYAPTLGGSLEPGLYTDPDTFYAPGVISQTVFPSLYSDADTFRAPSIFTFYLMAANKVDNTNTFFAPIVNGSLAATLYSDPDTFYAPASISFTVYPQNYINTNTFYAASIVADVILTVPLYDDPDVIYDAALGGQLAPLLYTNTNTFFSPTIGLFASAQRVTDGETFHSPSIFLAYQMSTTLYTDPDTIYAASVTHGSLAPGLYTDPDTFYATIVAQGQVIAPALYADGETFHSANILKSNQIAPTLFSQADVFYAPSLSRSMSANTFTNTNTFPAGSITTGVVVITPPLYSELDQFPNPSTGPVGELTPGLVTEISTFHSATVQVENIDEAGWTPDFAALATWNQDQAADTTWTQEGGL